MSVSVNERVNGHAGNGVRKGDDKPVLIASHARDLLNLRRLPAMLTVAQTAVLLNRGEHDIPVLVRAGILKPLGDPPPNAVKFLATVEVLELADDRQALDRICAVLTEYWRGKNETRNGSNSSARPRPSRRAGNGNGQPGCFGSASSGPDKR
jgi:hypothetical protein